MWVLQKTQIRYKGQELANLRIILGRLAQNHTKILSNNCSRANTNFPSKRMQRQVGLSYVEREEGLARRPKGKSKSTKLIATNEHEY